LFVYILFGVLSSYISLLESFIIHWPVEGFCMNAKGIILLLISSLAYAGFVIANKGALNAGFPPFQLSLFMISGLTLISLFFLFGKAKVLTQMTLKEWGYVGIVGILASGVVQLLFIYGQQGTTALNAGFISTLAAPFTALLSVIIIGERLTLKRWGLILAAFTGIVVLTTGLRIAEFNSADGLLILAMALVALTNVLAKLAMRRLSGLFVNALRHLFGFLAVFLFAVFSNQLWDLQSVPGSAWPFFIASVLLTFGFLACFYWGIQLTSPTTATVIGLTIIVFTSSFAILFFKESLTLVQWCGGLAGVGAIAWFALDG
jgi:drug/metabolite transporter (DMT)-like permease